MTDRDIANNIWIIMKGISIPPSYTDKDVPSYTDKDVLEIIYRYWHRAMERDICLYLQ